MLIGCEKDSVVKVEDFKYSDDLSMIVYHENIAANQDSHIVKIKYKNEIIFSTSVSVLRGFSIIDPSGNIHDNWNVICPHL